MIVLVIVIVLLAVAASLAGTLVLRRRALRRRFGAEYDQLVQQVGPRKAQTELIERQRRVAKLDIRPLSAERRAGYVREWTSVQESFIDGPAQAVQAAAGLVSAVAADRGYPAGDDDRLLTDLSVYHANRLDGYRRARQATERASTAGTAGAAGAVDTEELRQALLGYRALFRDLIGPEPAGAVPAGEGVPAEMSGGKQPAAAAARASRARDDAGADGEGDGTGDGTDGADGEADGAGSQPAGDGGPTWVDSGRRDYRISTPASRKD